MGRNNGERAHSTGCVADTLAARHVLRKVRGPGNPEKRREFNARQKLQRVFSFHFRNGNLSTGLAVAPGRSNLGLRSNYEVLRQPVCSLFYLQSITIIPIIITTAIPAAHMTQTAARSGMCKNFATNIVNRLTIPPRFALGVHGVRRVGRFNALALLKSRDAEAPLAFC
jgi:hypothetical protein